MGTREYSLMDITKAIDTLKRLRGKLTQEKLAPQLGVDPEGYRRWESPSETRHRTPSHNHMVELVKYFANDLTLLEAGEWAENFGRPLTEDELYAIFQEKNTSVDYILITPADLQRHAWQTNLKLLDHIQPQSLQSKVELAMAKAKLYQQQGNLREAIDIYKSLIPSITQMESLEHHLACIRSNLAYLYTATDKNKWPMAMQLCQQALIFFKSDSNDTSNLAHTYNHLAIWYMRQESFEQAEDEFVEARHLWNKTNHEQGLRSTLLNLGACYVEWAKYEDALVHLQEAQQLVNSTDVEHGKILMNLSIVYRHKKDLETAKDYASKAEKIFQGYQNLTALAQVRSNLGRIYLTWQKFGEADCYLQNSLALWSSLKNLYGQEKVRSYRKEYDEKITMVIKEASETEHLQAILQSIYL